MDSGIKSLFIILILGGFSPLMLCAQHAKIDQAYKKGQLSLDQKVRYQIEALQNPRQLPQIYQQQNEQPFKCGTPAYKTFYQHRAKLSAATIQQVEQTTGAPSTAASQTFGSASGRFTIHYQTTGSNQVPPADGNANGVPDYVEEVAEAADSSYRHQVQTLGYTDPLVNGQPYSIEIVNLQTVYGQTIAPANENTTYIQIENDFAEDFPPNDDPEGNAIGSLKATVAHELKHAIQFAATRWSGETDAWAEMDATLMEEVVYDEVNDYYNYLEDPASIFSDPSASFYPGSYYHVSWALFFEEQYGADFWPSVWDKIRQDTTLTMVGALSQQLGGEQAFEDAYRLSQLWHYAAGPNRSANDFGFEERRNYPHASTEADGSFYSDNMKEPSPSNPKPLEGFSATYYTVAPPAASAGTVGIEFSTSSQTSTSGIGIIAFFLDGSSDFKSISNISSQSNTLSTSWEWSDLSSIGLVFTSDNTRRGTQEAVVKLGSLNYDTFTVFQNYPNPFRQSTTIRFILNKAADVTLKIYDISGRLVRTLIDEERTAGPYEESFDGRNLASGVYFYQLISGDEVIVKKMTLVK